MARIEKWDEVHGNQALDEKMMAFLDSATDQYAILQLRRSEDTVYERFSSMRELERMGLEPDIDHYEVVYKRITTVCICDAWFVCGASARRNSCIAVGFSFSG